MQDIRIIHAEAIHYIIKFDISQSHIADLLAGQSLTNACIPNRVKLNCIESIWVEGNSFDSITIDLSKELGQS